MTTLYLCNTAGEFVAFAQGGNLFTPEGDWLGVVRGHEVWNTAGEYIGALWPDGRLVRNRAGGVHRPILQPKQPIRPVRPLPPKRGLFLPEIPPPNEDVFLWLMRPLSLLTPLPRLHALFALEGATLIGGDGVFLGTMSRNRSAPDSLGNRAGQFGDPAADLSVFNGRGTYGSADSPLSPWTGNAPRPPRIEREGEPLGVLTVNLEIQNRVDPNDLVAWLAMR